MNIYIVRHGQSEANLKTYNECKEDCKISLTDEGTMQALEAGKFLSRLIGKNASEKSLIITSTYLRTLQTTKQIQKSLPLKTISDARLVEFDRGIFGKCKYKERRYKFPKEFQKYQEEMHSIDKFYAKPPEGESGADVYRRVKPVIYELRQYCKKRYRKRNNCNSSWHNAVFDDGSYELRPNVVLQRKICSKLLD